MPVTYTKAQRAKSHGYDQKLITIDAGGITVQRFVPRDESDALTKYAADLTSRLADLEPVTPAFMERAGGHPDDFGAWWTPWNRTHTARLCINPANGQVWLRTSEEKPNEITLGFYASEREFKALCVGLQIHLKVA